LATLPKISDQPAGARLTVRVKPKASRTTIIGVIEDALVVSLAAPPVDGQANATLTKALAKWLGVPPRAVTISVGEKSKTKLVAIAGLSAEDVRKRLLPLCSPPDSTE
jgi:uncharacterized protein (TIGR00251 family)